MVHTGRAVVFESIEDFHTRIDDDSLDIDESCVLVLKNCGPKGYPGMAEVGNMPLPPKVLKKGITDMVRISDARMSGTAYGTVVLHTAPEAAAGGPLAFVQNGDMIELDVPKRRLQLHRQRRRAAGAPRRLEGAGAAAQQRLLEALRRSRAAGRRGRRSRFPASASAARSCRATTTEPGPGSMVAAGLVSRSDVKARSAGRNRNHQRRVAATMARACGESASTSASSSSSSRRPGSSTSSICRSSRRRPASARGRSRRS